MPITVRDVLRLALPPDTGLFAGASGLSHQVTWIATPRATPPTFANLRGGEIVIAAMSALQALDDQLTIATLVERLAPVPVAAIVVVGPIDQEARAVADVARIPLLSLPATADVREVEREVTRLINDYDAQLERRGAQFAQLLTQKSLSGAGVQGLIDILAERTGCGVGCYTVGGDLRRFRARGSARVALQTLAPTTVGALTHLGQSIYVQALGAGNERLGFLTICGESLDDWDRTALFQCSTALALELSKEQAVQAAEERLRGDFVQAVLSGQGMDSEAVLQRGRELGYDLRQPHIALLCAVAGDPDDSSVNRLSGVVNTALTGLGVTLPTMRRADGVLCYLPAADRTRRARDVAEQLRVKVSSEFPIIIAIGKEAQTVSAWQRSLNEAEQALLIGRELLDTTRVFDFSDLGVYRLLILLRDKPELWEFYRSTLAALADYDHNQKAELLKTLHAFFDNLGNLARTAEVLHVHRNTLLYRLARISEISGMNLDDADDRLALWIALKAHRVLHSLERVS